MNDGCQQKSWGTAPHTIVRFRTVHPVSVSSATWISEAISSLHAFTIKGGYKNGMSALDLARALSLCGKTSRTALSLGFRVGNSG